MSRQTYLPSQSGVDMLRLIFPEQVTTYKDTTISSQSFHRGIAPVTNTTITN